MLETFETFQMISTRGGGRGTPPSPPAGAGTEGMVGLAALRGMPVPMRLASNSDRTFWLHVPGPIVIRSLPCRDVYAALDPGAEGHGCKKNDHFFHFWAPPE